MLATSAFQRKHSKLMIDIERDISSNWLLCQGVSQRSCAFLLGVRPKAIAIRIKRFGDICKENLEGYRKSRSKVTHAQLDELETFEKCKYRPLTVPVVVEAKVRKILSLAVG